MPSFSNLGGRSIIPLHPSRIQPPKSIRALDNNTRRRDVLQLSGGANAVPDIHNVQGDVFYVFPKVNCTRIFNSFLSASHPHAGGRKVHFLQH